MKGVIYNVGPIDNSYAGPHTYADVLFPFIEELRKNAVDLTWVGITLENRIENNKLKKELHPLELATWAHWKLVRIHPFQDGNGRTARIIMNFILHKNGYAMIDIKTKEKQQYFNALEKCHYNNNARALAIRLVRRFKKQYQNVLKE